MNNLQDNWMSVAMIAAQQMRQLLLSRLKWDLLGRKQHEGAIQPDAGGRCRLLARTHGSGSNRYTFLDNDIPCGALGGVSGKEKDEDRHQKAPNRS